MIDLSGLEELVAVRGCSGDEAAIKDYILKYVADNQSDWKVQPRIVEGKGFQDAFILVFGNPTHSCFCPYGHHRIYGRIRQRSRKKWRSKNH
jgi:hypothetical protein